MECHCLLQDGSAAHRTPCAPTRNPTHCLFSSTYRVVYAHSEVNYHDDYLVVNAHSEVNYLVVNAQSEVNYLVVNAHSEVNYRVVNANSEVNEGVGGEVQACRHPQC